MRLACFNHDVLRTGCSFVSRLGLYLGTLATLALVPSNAESGNMSSCNGIDTSPQTKLIISRLIASGIRDIEAANGAAYQSASRVAANLASKLSQDDFHVVFCVERSPNIDGSDFRPEVVKELDNRHVLFEVWGDLIAIQRGTADVTKVQGQVSYYMIPAPKNIAVWHQLHQQDFNFRSGQIPVWDLFTKVFNQGRQFEILASVAFAIQASYNRNYIGAQSAFCHARLALEQERRKGTWKDLAIDAGMLASGIDNLVKENDVAARTSQDSIGGLGLEDVARNPGCPHA